MPRITPMAVRTQIVQKYVEGQSISSISAELKISRKTIHTLIDRYKSHGEPGLKPHYRHCGKKRPSADDFVFRAARCLKTWHPSWGGEKIHAEISRARPTLSLPSVRTLHRWFRWNAQVIAKTKLPKAPPKWARTLHEGWQIDAKEHMRTADGQWQCWLNIIDECSGTVIDPPVFPLSKDLRSTHKRNTSRIDDCL